MKHLIWLSLLSLLQACDPYGFGFKKNPAFVINEAFEGVIHSDTARFVEVAGKEALCIYGNQEGLSYLKDKIQLNPEDIEINPRLIANSSEHTSTPLFVGFWSYYNEKYEVDILNKETKAEMLKVVVECHYGFDGSKKSEYRNLKAKKYKRKECRVIKVLSSEFELLPLPEECGNFEVNLNL